MRQIITKYASSWSCVIIHRTCESILELIANTGDRVIAKTFHFFKRDYYRGMYTRNPDWHFNARAPQPAQPRKPASPLCRPANGAERRVASRRVGTRSSAVSASSDGVLYYRHCLRGARSPQDEEGKRIYGGASRKRGEREREGE